MICHIYLTDFLLYSRINATFPELQSGLSQLATTKLRIGTTPLRGSKEPAAPVIAYFGPLRGGVFLVTLPLNMHSGSALSSDCQLHNDVWYFQNSVLCGVCVNNSLWVELNYHDHQKIQNGQTYFRHIQTDFTRKIFTTLCIMQK